MEGDEGRWLRRPEYLVLLASAFIIASISLFHPQLRLLNLQWYDLALKTHTKLGLGAAVSPRFVHVGIEDEDLLGRNTLESEYALVADVIEKVKRLGASVIGVDAVFKRADRKSAGKLVETAIENGPVVFGEVLPVGPGGSGKVMRSFPYLEDGYPYQGFLNVEVQDDGTFRDYRLVQVVGKRIQASFAFAIYMADQGLRVEELVIDWRGGRLIWEIYDGESGTFIPRIIGVKPAYLNFKGPLFPKLNERVEAQSIAANYFPYLSILQLNKYVRLEEANRKARGEKAGRDPSELPLAGRIVLISYAVTGISDIGSTPFGENEPLISLHLNALSGLFEEELIEEAGIRMQIVFFTVCIGAMLLLTRIRRTFIFLTGTLLTVVVVQTTAFGLLPWKQIFASPMGASLLLVGVACTGILRRFLLNLFERERLHSTFRRYFSVEVFREVLENPDSLEPKVAEITVLLSDVRDFTSIAEKHEVHEVFEYLNRIFEIETRCALIHEGNLQHLTGDQFLAYWGAPNKEPDHADKALRAALKIVAELKDLAGENEEDRIPFSGCGIALDTGTVGVGNLGSIQRQDYSIIGDCVNAAARIEALTKVYRIPLLISETALSHMKDKPPHRLIDVVVLKGRQAPVQLYEVESAASRQPFDDLVTAFSKSFEVYRSGDFAAAEKSFHDVAAEFDDPVSAAFAERCRGLQSAPPENWDGVFVMTTK